MDIEDEPANIDVEDDDEDEIINEYVNGMISEILGSQIVKDFEEYLLRLEQYASWHKIHMLDLSRIRSEIEADLKHLSDLMAHPIIIGNLDDDIYKVISEEMINLMYEVVLKKD